MKTYQELKSFLDIPIDKKIYCEDQLEFNKELEILFSEGYVWFFSESTTTFELTKKEVPVNINIRGKFLSFEPV